MKHFNRPLPRVFRRLDLSDEFKSESQYNNWLITAQRNGLIVMVRKGLYALVDPSTNDIYANKFEIASKILIDAYVCYHGALDYYGLANQVFNNVYVAANQRFLDFEFQGIDYIRVQPHDNSVGGVFFSSLPYLKVTSLEKTIVDCIDDIGLAGGIDELLNALLSVRKLDEKEVINCLDGYNQIFLYQKAGYLFEKYNDKLGFSKDFFDYCQNKETNQKKYFLKDEFAQLVYNPKWKLITPKDLKSRPFEGIE